MPKQYEAIRDSYLSAGKDEKTAKKFAAMTFNAHRKPGVAPVGPHSDSIAGKMQAHLKRTRG